MSLEDRMSFQRSVLQAGQAPRGASGSNPMAKSNLLRARAASDIGNALPNLGKTLTHHQIIPAAKALSANSPAVDIGKAVLSSTGGNPSRVAGQLLRHAKSTIQISPFDRRRELADGMSKLASHSNSLSGLL
jgi:hypothetical protein